MAGVHDEPVFPKPSSGVTHGKGNVSNNEITEKAIASNIIDEPVKSLVALTSMPAPCFENDIVQNPAFPTDLSSQIQCGPLLAALSSDQITWCTVDGPNSILNFLQEIAFLLTDISDLARFCAVCTAWRNVVYTTQAPKPSCLPCHLILTYDPSLKVEYGPCSLSLISSSFSESYADARQLGDVPHRIAGTGHGWLVSVSELNMTTMEFSIFLLNPLTGIRIYLPSSASFNVPERSSNTRNAYSSLRATISLLEGSKSPASGCIVMITWECHWGFSFCRYTGECHEGKWTTVEETLPYKRYRNNIVSFAYHQGKVLAHDLGGEGFLVDTASLSITLVDPPHSYRTDYVCLPITPRIVEASGEVFLAVYLLESGASVFRLDLTVRPPRWCRTTNIGNRAFFIDLDQLQCVTMQDHVKLDLRKNCIYFVNSRYIDIDDSLTHSVLVCQLDNETVEELPLRFKSSLFYQKPNWLFPSLI